MKTTAFFVLITWPNGTEGLLFPRPGNVPVADTQDKGMMDFGTAKEHLEQYQELTRSKRPFSPSNAEDLKGTVIRLIKFERQEVVHEFTL